MFIVRKFTNSYVELTRLDKIIPIPCVLFLELTELGMESAIFWRESKYPKLFTVECLTDKTFPPSLISKEPLIGKHYLDMVREPSFLCSANRYITMFLSKY